MNAATKNNNLSIDLLTILAIGIVSFIPKVDVTNAANEMVS